MRTTWETISIEAGWMNSGSTRHRICADVIELGSNRVITKRQRTTALTRASGCPVQCIETVSSRRAFTIAQVPEIAIQWTEVKTGKSSTADSG